MTQLKEIARIPKIDKPGQVKSRLILEALVDIIVEKRRMGFDHAGAPDLEIFARSLTNGEQFSITVFNDKIPEIGSLVSSDFIAEQADISFFNQASSFSGKPVTSFGPGPIG